MKDDPRIVEIDGKRYAVERTSGNDPAIYTVNAIVSPAHISEPWKQTDDNWSAPVPKSAVVIIARLVEDSAPDGAKGE